VIIGVLRISMRLPSRDLKGRRAIVRPVVERLRSRYNAAVAEVGELNDPASATIGIVCISNESGHADSQLQSIAGAVEDWRLDAEIIDIETELISYG
jgi:uncharacterized protein